MNTNNSTVKLGELADIRSGHPFRQKLENTPLNWSHYVLQLKDIQKDCYINFQHVAKVKIEGSKPPHLLQQGDVLLRARGGYYYSGLIDTTLKNVLAVGQFFVITPKNINPAYLCWYLNQPKAQQYLNKNGTGSNIPMVNKRTVSELPITVPSILTQHKIANMHQGWLRMKKLNEKLINNHEMMLRGMCQQFIQQDLKQTRTNHRDET
jgi:hypothetical protein